MPPPASHQAEAPTDTDKPGFSGTMDGRGEMAVRLRTYGGSVLVAKRQRPIRPRRNVIGNCRTDVPLCGANLLIANQPVRLDGPAIDEHAHARSVTSPSTHPSTVLSVASAPHSRPRAATVIRVTGFRFSSPVPDCPIERVFEAGERARARWKLPSLAEVCAGRT